MTGIAGRMGVACQWLDDTGRVHVPWKFRGLNRQNYLRFGNRRLHEVATHNARVLMEVVCTLARAPRHRRMFRIGNHVLPCLTLPEARSAWRDRGFVRDLENAYVAIGRAARSGDVRLSTHPSQYIVPNSTSAHVRQTSIMDLDGWAHYAACLNTPDFCMNIHLGPGFDGTMPTMIASWRTALGAISRDARRFLTLENDDKLWTAQHLLHVARAVGLRPCVDVHHHWCVTGHWPNAASLGRAVVPLWNDVRPKIHISLPRARYYRRTAVDRAGMPMLDMGESRTSADGAVDRYLPLAHADYGWAPGLPRYARDLLAWSDGMVELKQKNLAVVDLERRILALRD